MSVAQASSPPDGSRPAPQGPTASRAEVQQTAFPFPAGTSRPAALHITLVGRDESFGEGTYDYHRSYCPHTAFEFIEEGRLDMVINGCLYHMQPGDLYLLNRGCQFRARDERGMHWRKTWFVATGAVLDSMMASYDLSGWDCLPQCPVGALFARMYQTAAAPWADRAAAERALAATAFEIILTASSSIPTARREIPADVARARSWLDERVTENVSLQDLAHLMNCSTAHASRLFRKELGITPHAYLLQRRIEEAKLLLVHGRLSVKEIGFRLGFCDQYHFSNTFSQKVGKSPLAFRNQGPKAPRGIKPRRAPSRRRRAKSTRTRSRRVAAKRMRVRSRRVSAKRMRVRSRRAAAKPAHTRSRREGAKPTRTRSRRGGAKPTHTRSRRPATKRRRVSRRRSRRAASSR